jgi:hypothetical protein
MNLETRLQRMRSNGEAFKQRTANQESRKIERPDVSISILHGFLASGFFPAFLRS